MPYLLDPTLFPKKVRKQVLQAVQGIGRDLYERYEVFENTTAEDGLPDELWDLLYAEAEKAADMLIKQFKLDPSVKLSLTYAIHDIAIDAP